ncbi:uncharacterized protein LOC113272661 [Papaver somniferum]|uniref:uncharacterized protein LOC113272661 n=1 Tax=Papaver somniferum TaxID=3469 RepID=UPI000E6F6518|nr:uncharacterized protein LOC113272661 [Papaver somniferum]
MAGRLNLLETQNSGKLPSQPINSRETVNVVTLRSGTRTVQPEDAEKSKDPKGPVLEKEIIDSSQTDEVPKTNSKPLVSTYVPPLPFPGRFANKNVEQDKEILDVLKTIHVNIPLIDAIRQVPKYARVLKDLCTKKKRLTGNEVMSVGGNVSAILQKKLPPKCKDTGSFDIPVVIGNKRFGKAMLDLGASVNVMPASIYESLNLGPLKETRIVLELADRSNVYPRGNIEDVLVQVNQLIVPADFVVLEMDSGSDASIPLLLGRPFMKTAKTVIDVDNGTLTMEFDDEKICFNIFGAMRYPSDVYSDFHANVVELWRTNGDGKYDAAAVYRGDAAAGDRSVLSVGDEEKLKFEMSNGVGDEMLECDREARDKTRDEICWMMNPGYCWCCLELESGGLEFAGMMTLRCYGAVNSIKQRE